MESDELFDPARPLDWFDQLYRQAGGDPRGVPWAKGRPNPSLVEWCEREQRPRAGERVLVVGCGLGDDAEYWASRGAAVTAFDLSPTAIAWCRERWAGSGVDYQVADLFTADWGAGFDLVFESYTLQALPAEIRSEAFARVAAAVAAGGELLVQCRAREASDPVGKLPWPLTRAELDQFSDMGLTLLRFEDFDDAAEPGKRRFRTHWRSTSQP
jgi:SAM-dependent methyltransferase